MMTIRRRQAVDDEGVEGAADADARVLLPPLLRAAGVDRPAAIDEGDRVPLGGERHDDRTTAATTTIAIIMRIRRRR